MSLENRITAFDTMASRFKAIRPSKLIALHEMTPATWSNLSSAALTYLSRNLDSVETILDEKEILKRYIAQWDSIVTITPNGMIVPKRHTMLEYNLLVRAFAKVISALGIQDLIVSWHVPLNVRIKRGMACESNLKRHHPTEHIHSDSWAGESSDSVTVHIPLFGDTERNCVVFFDPPRKFEESWLKPLSSYVAGKAIAEQYKEIDFRGKKGQVVLADFSTLHRSTHLPGAAARVSIDTTFVLRKPASNEGERIHPWRENERVSPEVLNGVGETHFCLPPARLRERVMTARYCGRRSAAAEAS